MRALFEAVATNSDRQLLDAEWERLLGAELTGALRSYHLLEPAGVHTTYPCDNPDRCCARKVEPNTLPNPRCSHVAYCQADLEDRWCDELDLNEDQLQASRFSSVAFLQRLQFLLGLPVTETQREARFDSTFVLGRRAWGGTERTVLVSWPGRHPGFEGFLAKHQLGTGPALVLVPRRDDLSVEVQKAHDSGHVVEVVGLDQVLAFAAGKFGLTELAREKLAMPVPTHCEVPGETAFCMAITEQGKRDIALAEYRQLVADPDADELGLFLDLMSTVKAGNYPGGRRELDGRYVPVALRPMEALAVAEVWSSARPLREQDLNIDSAQAGKAFQEGRKQLDLQLEHKQWRSFPTLPGDVPAENRYAFTPPEGLRFLLLCRLQSGLTNRS